ncbi:MAG: hypothetical protein MR609_02085 [Bacteroidales bacterium]|nr:hypothetical protein [Bacteroidales bacterium]
MKCPVASPGCQGRYAVLTPGYFRAMPTASPYPYRGDGTTRIPYDPHTNPVRIPYEPHTNPIRTPPLIA